MNTPHSASEVARRYHETWNEHDTRKIVDYFTPEGFYSNPDTNPGIRGDALTAHLDGLWTAVPDLHLVMLDAGEIKPNLIAHHWLCTGTVAVLGPDGGEPTKRTFAMKGVSIVKVEGDKIASDHVYFDRKGIDEQLAAS
jgi:hypothetical protein